MGAVGLGCRVDDLYGDERLVVDLDLGVPERPEVVLGNARGAARAQETLDAEVSARG